MMTPFTFLLLGLASAGVLPQLDRHGDALPPGAAMRLGTLRFRTHGWFASLAYTPDGRFLVSGGIGGAIVWDAATGKEVRRLGTDLPDPGGSAGLSRDGKLVAVGGSDCNGKAPAGGVYEMATGRRVYRFGADSGLTVGQFSLDGTVLAAYGSALSIALHDAATGKLLRRLEGHERTAFSTRLCVLQVIFSRDGKRLISASDDGTLRVWNVADGKPLLKIDVGSGAAVYRMALSPDDGLLASQQWVRTAEPGGGSLTSLANVLRLWDLRSGKEIRRIAPPAEAGKEPPFVGRLLEWTPDGAAVLTAGADIQAWDPQTGKLLRRLSGDDGPVHVLAFAPGGKTFAATDGYFALRICDSASGRTLLQPEGHRDMIEALAVSADGRTVASADSNRTIFVWDVATGKPVRRIADPKCPIESLVFTPDGRTLCLPFRQRVLAWNIATGELQFKAGASLPATHHPSVGKIVPSAQADQTIVVTDSTTGKPRATRIAAPPYEVTTYFPIRFLTRVMELSPDGRTLAWTLPREGAICLSEVATGQERRRLAGHRGCITKLAFAANGRVLVSGAEDTTCLVWDLAGPARPLHDADRTACWDELRSEDAAQAYAAMRRLLGDPDRAAALLAERLRPAPPPDAQRIARLIADLDSDEFAPRDEATKELEKIGETTLPALRKTLAGTPPLEVRRRVEKLVANLEALNPERLRVLRAVETLEYLATPQARQVLRALAKGAAGPRQTTEARAALARLSAVGK
jgi:WD40 repeat protein